MMTVFWQSMPWGIAALVGALAAVIGALWLEAHRRRRAFRELGERLDRFERRLERLESPHRDGPPSEAAAKPTRADGGRRFEPTLITVPDLSASFSDATSVDETSRRASAADLSRRFPDVWRLAEAGHPIEEIAEITGRTVGHVELILALRARLSGAETGSKGAGS